LFLLKLTSLGKEFALDAPAFRAVRLTRTLPDCARHSRKKHGTRKARKRGGQAVPPVLWAGRSPPPAHAELSKAGRENRTRPGTPLDPSPLLRLGFVPTKSVGSTLRTMSRGRLGGSCFNKVINSQCTSLASTVAVPVGSSYHFLLFTSFFSYIPPGPSFRLCLLQSACCNVPSA
jgi:hypothetical protein